MPMIPDAGTFKASRRAEAAAFLILRLCVGYFLLIWGLSKLVIPQQTQALFNYFYGINIGNLISYLFGVGETAVAIGIILGLWRRLSYGVGLLIHMVTVVVTIKFWVHPLAMENGVPVNRLYVTALPALAAFVALYALRAYDTWSVDAWLARRRANATWQRS